MRTRLPFFAAVRLLSFGVFVLLLVILTSGNSTFGQVPTTIQRPTFGVSIDASGMMQSIRFSDSDKLQLLAKARQRIANGGDVQKPSPMRCISLHRLDDALGELKKNGGSPTDTMQRLVGLQRIEYIFAEPGSQDIIVAGPAEGWFEGNGGRYVGAQSGTPPLELEDLIVALRTITDTNGWVGCTIEPRRESLKKVVEFNRTIPKAIPDSARSTATVAMHQGLTKALGHANVRVMGLEPTTRMAATLVEADYRMKHIAIGVEPPPVKMKTFASTLKSPPASQLQRWWLTPAYNKIETNEERSVWKLHGQG
ncbi:MAG: DUF1598 domain-containing protein, partial [Planctomycetota bacterium]